LLAIKYSITLRELGMFVRLLCTKVQIRCTKDRIRDENL